MKLKLALEIAQDCGLETVGEALYNIRLHAGNIFNYGEEQKEWDELIADYKSSGLNENDSVDICLAGICGS